MEMMIGWVGEGGEGKGTCWPVLYFATKRTVFSPVSLTSAFRSGGDF